MHVDIVAARAARPNLKPASISTSTEHSSTVQVSLSETDHGNQTHTFTRRVKACAEAERGRAVPGGEGRARGANLRTHKTKYFKTRLTATTHPPVVKCTAGREHHPCPTTLFSLVLLCLPSLTHPVSTRSSSPLFWCVNVK